MENLLCIPTPGMFGVALILFMIVFPLAHYYNSKVMKRLRPRAPFGWMVVSVFVID